jgi:K+-dependent Na+/Ca+ exchanger-like protein
MLRALYFLALSLIGARAKISGSDCSYGPDKNLCIPKYCDAPSKISTLGKIDPVTGQPIEYQFHPKGLGGGGNFSFPVKFGGYELEQICPKVVTLPGGGGLGATYPVGCGPVSPIPNPGKKTDQEMIAIWFILIIYFFYVLALVCEEFLVPAINILCERTGIPDDVAGATLLAAGCNSPEFFASIIGIFIADSTVGVGTVVGSAPFNVCCITGGAALAVGGALTLDPWLMGRELLGLIVALVIFLLIMDDYRIMWYEALILVFYYAAIYVPVLAYFTSIQQFLLLKLAGISKTPELEVRQSSSAIDFKTGDLSMSAKDGIRKSKSDGGSGLIARDNTGVIVVPSSATFGGGVTGRIASGIASSLSMSQKATFAVPHFEKARNTSSADERPDVIEPSLRPVVPAGPLAGNLEATFSGKGAPGTEDIHDSWVTLVAECKKRLPTYTSPPAEDGFSGILLKRPRGFTKVRVRRIPWQERYFVLDNHPTNAFRYSHVDKPDKFVTVPLQTVRNIERVSLEEVHLVFFNETIKLRAPVASAEGADAIQRWFDQLVVKIDAFKMTSPPPKLHGEEDAHAHEHPPWWQMPEEGNVAKAIHILTFPWKAPIFLTTPNVLKAGNEKYFALTIALSMFWLAIFATLMTDVIEYLGCALGIGGTVMGLSFGAVGTSFPNLYASILVAKQGQGGMAICQAIASNTFNVCICLGLLWLFHTAGLSNCDYGEHGDAHQMPCGGCYTPDGLAPLCPYLEGTNNEFALSPGSTKGAVLVAFVWMVLFVISLVFGQMTITKVPAYLMFGLYGLYILYEYVNAFAPEGSKPTLCFDFWNICV